jgi:hypothetical protein
VSTESKGVTLQTAGLLPQRMCAAAINDLAWFCNGASIMQRFDVVRHQEDLWSVMSNGQAVYYFTTPEEADDAAFTLENLSGVCCRHLSEEDAHRRPLEQCSLFGDTVGALAPPVAWTRPRSCTCLAMSWWGLHKGYHSPATQAPI